MSYVVTQQPDAVNLTSTLKDIILTTITDTDIVVKINGTDVIVESYKPDSDNKIYVRDLGKLIAGYLSGSGFESYTHAGIVCTVVIEATQGATTTTVGTYSVMLCNAYTDVEASYFSAGKVFLHALTRKKHTLPTAQEYLSVSLANGQKVRCFVTTSDFVNSAKVYFYTAPAAQIKKLDVSFAAIAALFPAIDPDTIIAYRMELEREIAVYMVDRAAYLLTLQFRYYNYFEVPETIITRGNIVRKGKSTYDKARIGGIDTKFNNERNDVFSAKSGKLFNTTDPERYREFFDSEFVEVYFAGKWIKVIVEETNNEQTVRLGNMTEIQFEFMFADYRYNSSIEASAFASWILEAGQWEDNNVWLDAEHWND